MNNVSYLYYGQGPSGEKSRCPDDYWKMLIERELIIPINWAEGPMWRLMFIELNKPINGTMNGHTVRRQKRS